MLFDLLAPPQGPRGQGPKKCAVAHPIHASNSHIKFGWISSNGLGGYSVTDGRRRLQYPRRFLKKGIKIILNQVKCQEKDVFFRFFFFNFSSGSDFASTT